MCSSDLNNRQVPLPDLSAAGVHYGIPGYGLAYRTGIDFGQLQICAPRRGERINMANPAESFNVADLFSLGLFFQVNQKRYDDAYLLTSLDFARNLFEQDGKISSLELRLRDDADPGRTKAAVIRAVGSDYVVRDRAEQHSDTFNVMKIEKFVAWLFLTDRKSTRLNSSHRT